MRPQSAKSKGRRLQQAIASDILACFPHLSPDDVKSTPSGCNGEDVLLSDAARACFPFSVEAKNQEKVNVWSALDQASDPNRPHEPLLVLKRNRSETYAVVRWRTLLRLLKNGSAPRLRKEIDKVVHSLLAIRGSMGEEEDLPPLSAEEEDLPLPSDGTLMPHTTEACEKQE